MPIPSIVKCFGIERSKFPEHQRTILGDWYYPGISVILRTLIMGTRLRIQTKRWTILNCFAEEKITRVSESVEAILGINLRHDSQLNNFSLLVHQWEI